MIGQVTVQMRSVIGLYRGNPKGEPTPKSKPSKENEDEKPKPSISPKEAQKGRGFDKIGVVVVSFF